GDPVPTRDLAARNGLQKLLVLGRLYVCLAVRLTAGHDEPARGDPVAGLLVEPDLVYEALHRVLDRTVGLGHLQALLTAQGLGHQLLELAALLVGVLTPGLLGLGRDVAG